MGVTSFIVMNVMGNLYYKLGPRPIVMTGLSMLALTTFAWSQVGLNSPNWLLMLIVSGRGIGLGMFGQIVQVTAFNNVPPEQLPRATSLVNVFQRLDTAFSTAILTSALIIGLSWAGAPAGTSIAAGDAPVPDMLTAFRYCFALMTIVSLVGVGLAFFLKDQVWEEQRAHREDPTPIETVRKSESERTADLEMAAGD
jgi:DHA2 family lincomycin resistance protein-like MFS transporter